MNTEKTISITVYQADGTKFHTNMMTLVAARIWVSKWMKKGDSYMAWDFAANKEIKL